MKKIVNLESQQGYDLAEEGEERGFDLVGTFPQPKLPLHLHVCNCLFHPACLLAVSSRVTSSSIGRILYIDFVNMIFIFIVRRNIINFLINIIFRFFIICTIEFRPPSPD